MRDPVSIPPCKSSSRAVEPVVSVMMSCCRCSSWAAVWKPLGTIFLASSRNLSALPSEMPFTSQSLRRVACAIASTVQKPPSTSLVMSFAAMP